MMQHQHKCGRRTPQPAACCASNMQNGLQPSQLSCIPVRPGGTAAAAAAAPECAHAAPASSQGSQAVAAAARAALAGEHRKPTAADSHGAERLSTGRRCRKHARSNKTRASPNPAAAAASPRRLRRRSPSFRRTASLCSSFASAASRLVRPPTRWGCVCRWGTAARRRALHQQCSGIHKRGRQRAEAAGAPGRVELAHV